MSWLNLFTGLAQRSAFPEYELITPTDDVTLVWPTESFAGVPYVADWIDVNSTDCDFIRMPDARQAATGISMVIANIGTDAFELQSNTGVSITMVDPGTAWVILLTDNSTQSGTWREYQLGAGTSDAQAGALAGAGLEANLTLLRSKIATVIADDTDLTLTESHRASAIVLTGANSHIFQLSTIGTGSGSTLKPGWWCLVTNEASNTLTIDASGSDTINQGLGSFDLPAATTDLRFSALIVCASTGFHVFGGFPTPLPIEAGGTGATNVLDILINLGATPIGAAIFSAPSAAAILTLLGITQNLLTEVTVSTNQTLVAADAGKVYVCTSAVTLNLPEADTVGVSYYIGVYAQGGDVTVDPPAADMVNGGALGAPLIIKQGASTLLVNDGGSPNGTWWTLFLDNSSGVWAVATGTADVIAAAYNPPQTVLTDGQLLYFRAIDANLTTTPTFAPDGLAAHPLTKMGGLPLAPGDIPNPLFEAIVRYNLANTRWELLNPAGSGSAGGGGSQWAVAGGTADVISVTYVPAVPALTDGLLLAFRALAPNATTTPTFQPNAQTAYPITKMGGASLALGDIPAAGFEALVRFRGTLNRWELMNPAYPAGSSGGGGGGGAGPATFTRLRVANNSGTPGSQIDVSAASVSVAPASGTPSVLLLGVSVTINALTIGVPNGLDAGSLSNNTWYAVYVISDGTNTAGLLSSSFTAPALPAGYTHFGRVGAVRTNAVAQFRRTLQYGRTARYTEALPVMASGSAGSVAIPNWIAVSTGNYVPPTASEITVVGEAQGTNGCVIVAPNSAYGSAFSMSLTPPLDIQSPGSSNVIADTVTFMLESTDLYWASQNIGNQLYCYGWTDNL